MKDIAQSFKDNTASFTSGALIVIFSTATNAPSIVTGEVPLSYSIVTGALAGSVCGAFCHAIGVENLKPLALATGLATGALASWSMYESLLENPAETAVSAKPEIQQETSHQFSESKIDTEQPTLVARPAGKTYPALRL